MAGIGQQPPCTRTARCTCLHLRARCGQRPFRQQPEAAGLGPGSPLDAPQGGTTRLWPPAEVKWPLPRDTHTRAATRRSFFAPARPPAPAHTHGNDTLSGSRGAGSAGLAAALRRAMLHVRCARRFSSRSRSSVPGALREEGAHMRAQARGALPPADNNTLRIQSGRRPAHLHCARPRWRCWMLGPARWLRAIPGVPPGVDFHRAGKRRLIMIWDGRRVNARLREEDFCAKTLPQEGRALFGGARYGATVDVCRRLGGTSPRPDSTPYFGFDTCADPGPGRCAGRQADRHLRAAAPASFTARPSVWRPNWSRRAVWPRLGSQTERLHPASGPNASIRLPNRTPTSGFRTERLHPASGPNASIRLPDQTPPSIFRTERLHPASGPNASILLPDRTPPSGFRTERRRARPPSPSASRLALRPGRGPAGFRGGRGPCCPRPAPRGARIPAPPLLGRFDLRRRHGAAAPEALTSGQMLLRIRTRFGWPDQVR